MNSLQTFLDATDKVVRQNILFTIKELQGYVRYKSVKEVLQAYRDELTTLTIDGLGSKTSSGDMSRQMKRMIKSMARDAYTEGLLEGGVDEEELEDEDERIIDEWVAEQTSYTLEYAKSITEARKSDDDEEVTLNNFLTRVEYWVDNLNVLANKGYASAKSDMMVRWRLGETEEHCATCSKLNGQRHRLSWFTSRDYLPQQRGSEELQCGGWKCDCRLEDMKGNTVMP